MVTSSPFLFPPLIEDIIPSSSGKELSQEKFVQLQWSRGATGLFYRACFWVLGIPEWQGQEPFIAGLPAF